MPEDRQPKVEVILHPEFGRRATGAADSNPEIPPAHHGRLGWFSDQFAKRGDEVSREMVRKYLSGVNMPRKDRMTLFAEILGVDVGWLQFGTGTATETKKSAIRNAQASGVVNVVAGAIQINGGSPAFPEADDARAAREHIDLYAIIRGAQYAIHVAMAEKEGDGYAFHLPLGLPETTFVIGVVQTGPLCFEMVELDAEGVAEHGRRGKSSVSVNVDAKYRTDGHAWNRIETFAKRL